MPNINIGVLLYRNQDGQFEDLLSKKITFRTIKVDFVIIDTVDGIALLARDEDNVEAKYELKIKKQIAQNIEKSLENIKSGLSKTGSSIFKIDKIEIKFSNQWFLQLSSINELRRETLKILEEKRILLHKRIEIKLLQNESKYPEERLDYKGNVINKFAEKFYKQHGVISIEPGFELSKDRDNEVLMQTKYCIKYELGQCYKQTDGKMGLNKQLFLENRKVKLKIEFDCRNCEMKIS
jgi:putative protease